MICATRDIILMNRRLDKASRRDVYVPVQISGVSVYDSSQSSQDGGYHSLTETYKLRIPVSAPVQGGRSYVQESHYDLMEDEEASACWTLHTEDLIILCAEEFSDVNTVAYQAPEAGFFTMEEAETLADEIGFMREPIHITGYADNTLRGSDRVKHWRIGGA